ncbi:FmdB family zinc ribbon protein [Propionibacteriaceae bacterium Y2011]|uniref:FmdB family zinc ribbon protein n=1 Tax=Microlunatus sp. Y2014 TaxID=3418488 RepID=UPI003B44F48E
MPTYQYRCTSCGSDLEVVQKFTDPSLTECPECAGALKKVFNAVGVVFKGSGFYKTDNRDAKRGSSTSNGDSSSDSKKSESSTSEGASGAGKGEPKKAETKKAEPSKAPAAAAS